MKISINSVITLYLELAYNMKESKENIKLIKKICMNIKSINGFINLNELLSFISNFKMYFPYLHYVTEQMINVYYNKEIVDLSTKEINFFVKLVQKYNTIKKNFDLC